MHHQLVYILLEPTKRNQISHQDLAHHSPLISQISITTVVYSRHPLSAQLAQNGINGIVSTVLNIESVDSLAMEQYTARLTLEL